MRERKLMYKLLEDMIKSAELRDRDGVLRSHDKYKILASKVYSKPPSDLDLQYDNCRNACVMSVTMLEEQHDRLIQDTKERFSRIPRP